MKEITTFDKILMFLTFLIVIGIFILAYVMKFQGGLCVINPCEYAWANDISCFVPRIP